MLIVKYFTALSFTKTFVSAPRIWRGNSGEKCSSYVKHCTHKLNNNTSVVTRVSYSRVVHGMNNVHVFINPLNPKLNSICYLLALLAHHFLHVSRIMVKSLTLRLLMSYIYTYIYIYMTLVA